MQPASTPPQRLGKFLLQGELGRGGMGVVHRAFDEALRRPVAIKVLTEAHSDAALARFRRELGVIARLRHPSIVAVHEATVLGGSPAIVMDLVQGVTLDQALAPPPPASPLPLRRALEAVRDAARALHFAHEQGVVHRDVKPQNIMLDEDGRVVVVDFGLAAVVDPGQSRLTRSDATVGTPAYVPPEQISSAGAPPDRRSDVYGLGATLYHVLTGRAPFAGASGLELLAAVLTTDPVPPGSINPLARGDLETICLECLEKDPARRYASAAIVADELDRYLAGQAVLARPLGRVARLLGGARGHRLTAALVVALLGGAAWAVRARAERVAAVEEERARVLASARADVERTLQLLAAAPGADDASLGLALALDAYEAGLHLAALAPDDAGARALASRAALACADAALRAGQWSLAAATAERARRLAPDEEQPRALLARIEAARAQAAAERAGPGQDVTATDDAAALVAQGMARANGGDLAGGLADLTRAVERYPDDDDALRNRGELRLRAGDLAGAAADHARAAALVPTKRPSWSSLGDERRALGDLDGAIAAFTRAIELEPGHGASWRGRGEARARKREFRQALEDLDRAVALNPAVGASWELRGEVRLQLRDLEGAVSDLTRAIELSPGVATAYVRRASALGLLGEHARSLADITRAIELAPASSDYRLYRAVTRRQLNDLAGALEDLDVVLAATPDRELAWYERGLTRAAAGELDLAIADLERALALASEERAPAVRARLEQARSLR